MTWFVNVYERPDGAWWIGPLRKTRQEADSGRAPVSLARRVFVLRIRETRA